MTFLLEECAQLALRRVLAYKVALVDVARAVEPRHVRMVQTMPHAHSVQEERTLDRVGVLFVAMNLTTTGVSSHTPLVHCAEGTLVDAVRLGENQLTQRQEPWRAREVSWALAAGWTDLTQRIVVHHRHSTMSLSVPTCLRIAVFNLRGRLSLIVSAILAQLPAANRIRPRHVKHIQHPDELRVNHVVHLGGFPAARILSNRLFRNCSPEVHLDAHQDAAVPGDFDIRGLFFACLDPLENVH